MRKRREESRAKVRRWELRWGAVMGERRGRNEMSVLGGGREREEGENVNGDGWMGEEWR